MEEKVFVAEEEVSAGQSGDGKNYGKVLGRN